MFDEKNCLTTAAIEQLKSHADMIDCECPTHLLEILSKIREFSSYSRECIVKFPKDMATHKWLLQSSQNLDSLLSSTIAQLARFEGFVDANNNFVSRET